MKEIIKKSVLPKNIGWIILISLVFLDAVLDLIFAKGKGLESPVWKPIANLFGITNPVFMVPFVLLIFYFFVKGLSRLIEKTEKIIYSEELVLTTLVLVYGVFDLWLILFYLFNFGLIKNHFYLIPILIAVGILYDWWAEKKLKEK